jgi:hypothetical protein
VFFRSFVPTGLVLNLTPNPGTEVPGYFHLVPMGLVLNPMHNPGTEVPGYFHLVPTGRKVAKLLAVPSIVRRGAYHNVLGGATCRTITGCVNFDCATGTIA